MNKDGLSYNNDGRRIYLENKHSLDKIEYKPHPKYAAIKKLLTDKMAMLNNKDRTLISEQVAAEERLDK